ncbi:MAG: DUF86 domain-containing protein [Bacteroidetes bacterium]|nr:DUF86 domain-containing protein [Bacteroidota bacterium]
MDDQQRKYLADILMSIHNIDIHLQHKRDYFLFESNITIRSAVKYEFSVVGEAVYELMKLKPAFTITNASRIISFRNRIVHEYDTIDHAQVWTIIVNYLPKLESEVKALLAD